MFPKIWRLRRTKKIHISNSAATGTSGDEYRVYKRRWFILGLCILNSASNSCHWLQYSIIANIIMKYYNVGSSAVDWTSMAFMLIYIPLIFPASYFLYKYGLRISTILGTFFTCVASWIKLCSVHPDLFWVGMIGQIVAAIAQVFILSIPTRLAAVWFGQNQVSSACNLGALGNQLGIVVGFLLSPMFVKMHDNVDDIGSDLSFLFYSIAGFSTVVFFVTVLFFQDEPPTAPSAAVAQSWNIAETATDSTFSSSMKRLAVNPAYVLLVLSYGINIGVCNAISTLLNQIILKYNPGSEEDAGRIGFLIVFAGMLGSVVGGVVLDITHKFKETIIFIYISSFISMIIFTFTQEEGIVVDYIVLGIIGFFIVGYFSIGFDVAAEITYPEPEGTSTGIIIASTQAFGLAFTLLYSWLFNSYGDLWANGSMCVMLAVGLVLTVFMKVELHRQKAQDIDSTANLENGKSSSFLF